METIYLSLSQQEQELYIRFQQVLNALMLSDTQKNVYDFIHPNFCGFDISQDYSTLLAELSRKLRPFGRSSVDSHPFIFHMIKVQLFGEGMGMVLATIKKNQFPYHLRCSVIFKKEDDQWFLYHIHLSKSKLKIRKCMYRLQHQSKWSDHPSINSDYYVDQLTGLYNRNKFNEVLEFEIQVSKQSGTPLSLIFADIDHFKMANDEHGHLIGDEVLKMIGFLLRYGVRENDSITRWGGDEFMILLPNTTHQAAIVLAERLRHTLIETNNEYQIMLSMCFGIAQYDGKESAESLIQRADTALYQAKNRGRNRVELQT